MMRVEQQPERLSAPEVLTTVLNEFSTITNYRALQDSLPRRLAQILKSQYVLFYKRINETLQFVSGTFDEQPGWTTSLLTVAQINPIELSSDRPEARAWSQRRAALASREDTEPGLVAVPLIYRQRAIGVLVVIRTNKQHFLPGRVSMEAQVEASERAAGVWSPEEVQVLVAVAGVSAMLLENALLLERDRERIHELSLLNSIGSQINNAVHDLERLRSIILQRTKEIAEVDLCELHLPESSENRALEVEWFPEELQKRLFQDFHEQRQQPRPLILERPGGPATSEYLSLLPAAFKTCFVLPLISGSARSKHGRLPSSRGEGETRVLGIIVGAYYRPWKLHHEQLMLLQVLASQASAALENIHLMTEVIEARNEARKLLRQALNDQRLKELILESIPSGLITIDIHGKVTTFNRAGEAILGYHPYEVLNQPIERLLTLPEPSTEVKEKECQNETLITLDRQGQERVLDVTILLLRSERGTQVGKLVAFSDVTSMRQLEEEKRRLAHLASLGKMAASVAHEVRNPLASIKITMQMLMADLQAESDPDEAQESISVVLKEVERLDNIVRDLLLFAKPRQLHRVPCDLIELNERILSLLRTRISEGGIDVHRVYPTREGDRNIRVLVDMEQMEQVLFNLYVNALQAMPEGGILTITFQVIQVSSGSMEESGTGEVEVQGSETQDWLELLISDTGIGIPPEQRELIFQPFFTTKAHGIGLGLSITQRLIEDHLGQISVESHLGYGATFSIRLPLSKVVEDGGEQEDERQDRRESMT